MIPGGMMSTGSPLWREDLARSSCGFHHLILTLETKPLLKLHPKFTLMQHKLQKAKHIHFGCEGVPGGFPDSLLLPPAFLGS